MLWLAFAGAGCNQNNPRVLLAREEPPPGSAELQPPRTGGPRPDVAAALAAPKLDLPDENNGSEHDAESLTIADALLIVEKSPLVFLVPQRSGKLRKHTGAEFSRLLQKKWRWLGTDIHELDLFVGQIASSAFASMEPYRVRHPDGTEEEFRRWLEHQLARKAQHAATEP